MSARRQGELRPSRPSSQIRPAPDSRPRKPFGMTILYLPAGPPASLLWRGCAEVTGTGGTAAPDMPSGLDGRDDVTRRWLARQQPAKGAAASPASQQEAQQPAGPIRSPETSATAAAGSR